MFKTLPIMQTLEVINHVATGAEFRRLRRANKLSLEEVADRVGMSITQLHRLEKGNAEWSDELTKAVKAAIAKG